MHRKNGHGDDLIQKTAAALDEDAIALMLLAVQNGNLQLSVKVALNRWVLSAGIEWVEWVMMLINIIECTLMLGSKLKLQQV